MNSLETELFEQRVREAKEIATQLEASASINSNATASLSGSSVTVVGGNLEKDDAQARAVEDSLLADSSWVASIKPVQDAPQRAKDNADARALEDALLTMLATSPDAAIRQAWLDVEAEIRRVVSQHKLDPKLPLKYTLYALNQRNLLTLREVRLITDLYELRNQVAHGRVGVGEEAGLDFIASAGEIIRRLRKVS